MSNIYATHQPPSEGGLFLKFEDKVPVKLRIVSEPYIFQNKYENKSTGETTWNTRYAWAIYNHDNGSGQILQLPPTAYRQIAAIAADPEWGDPTSYNIKITREGTGKDTKYSVVGSPQKTELTEEQKEEAGKVDVQKAISNAIPLTQFTSTDSLPKPAPTVSDVLDAIPGSKVVDEPPRKDEDAPNLDDIPFS